MPVYSVPVNGTEKLILADTAAQAVRAATKPLIGTVEALSPNQIGEKVAGGAKIEKASELLAGETPAETADGEQEEQQSNGE